MKQKPRYAFALIYFIRILLITILMVLLIFLALIIEADIWYKLLFILFVILVYISYMLIFLKLRSNRINFELNGLIDLSELKGDEIVLDLGAGTGQEAIFFAKSLPEGKVFGLDKYLYQDKNIWSKLRFILQVNDLGDTFENAKNNAIIEGVADKCEFIIGDFTKKFEFPDEYFDIIMSRQALYLMPKNKSVEVFQEVDRCLKRGGKIIFYECLKRDSWNMSDAKKFFKNKGYKTEILRPGKKRLPFFYAKKL